MVWREERATDRPVAVTRTPGHLATGSFHLDLRSLSAGIYLVQVEAGDFTATQKLVVQKQRRGT